MVDTSTDSSLFRGRTFLRERESVSIPPQNTIATTSVENDPTTNHPSKTRPQNQPETQGQTAHSTCNNSSSPTRTKAKAADRTYASVIDPEEGRRTHAPKTATTPMTPPVPARRFFPSHNAATPRDFLERVAATWPKKHSADVSWPRVPLRHPNQERTGTFHTPPQRTNHQEFKNASESLLETNKKR